MIYLVLLPRFLNTGNTVPVSMLLFINSIIALFLGHFQLVGFPLMGFIFMPPCIPGDLLLEAKHCDLYLTGC